MTPYVAYGGFKWTRSDIDSGESGRTMDGTMMRARVATKIRLDITCRLLKQSEAQIVLNAILPQYVTVQYTDPMYGVVTKTMYANNNPANYRIKKRNGEEYWEGITFPLIER